MRGNHYKIETTRTKGFFVTVLELATSSWALNNLCASQAVYFQKLIKKSFTLNTKMSVFHRWFCFTFFFLYFYLFYLFYFQGEISWTTSVTDSHQYLIFEFKDWKVINEIITQGHSSNDFVSEYMVYYGSNGQDYMTYRTSSGLPKVSWLWFHLKQIDCSVGLFQLQQTTEATFLALEKKNYFCWMTKKISKNSVVETEADEMRWMSGGWRKDRIFIISTIA